MNNSFKLSDQVNVSKTVRIAVPYREVEALFIELYEGCYCQYRNPGLIRNAHIDQNMFPLLVYQSIAIAMVDIYLSTRDDLSVQPAFCGLDEINNFVFNSDSITDQSIAMHDDQIDYFIVEVIERFIATTSFIGIFNNLFSNLNNAVIEDCSFVFHRKYVRDTDEGLCFLEIKYSQSIATPMQNTLYASAPLNDAL